MSEHISAADGRRFAQVLGDRCEGNGFRIANQRRRSTLSARVVTADVKMIGVIDDADTAQAKELLQALYRQVEDISHKLESVEERIHAVQGRAAVATRRRAADLRREFYEAHRLIDGLHRRFPDSRVAAGRV